MKIYTRRGDSGQTALLSGQKVDKDSLRVEAYGTLDELNCVLGLALSFCQNETVKQILTPLQDKLFSAGSDLATRMSSRREVERIAQQDWQQLEALIDQLQTELPPLKNFILPGGSPAASFIHFGRTVCRRAERLLVKLIRKEGDVNSELLIYLNRLSDLLFVLARAENIAGGFEETVWKGKT